jgi:hypothetical protein
MSMVDEPVDQRRGQSIVVDHRVPLSEFEVRRDGHATAFVAIGNHLEQELSRVPMQGQKAQLIHDEQIT